MGLSGKSMDPGMVPPYTNSSLVGIYNRGGGGGGGGYYNPY